MTSKETVTMRVAEVQRERFTLIENGTETGGRLNGSLLNSGNFPVVGDYVEVIRNPFGDSLIVEINPRRSYLSRPDRHGHGDGYVKNLSEQPIAANFDYVFIVTSLNGNFNVDRIARYIALTLNGGGIPVAVLSKADLCGNAGEYVSQVKAISDKADVVAVSAATGEGLTDLEKYFQKGITIALVGSSGVGKSTLLNKIAGKEVMKTGGIREGDDKGRHTTTYRRLFTLNSGVTIIDTPGMREIGVCGADEGIDSAFADITELFKQCRFGNCRHDIEPGCAVKRALSDGTLSEKRWRTYQRLCDENFRAKRIKSGYNKY